MVDVVLKGDKVLVTRSLELPAVPPLAKIPLWQRFEVNIDLKGLKQDSEVGKEILKEFRSFYEKQLSPKCDAQNRSLKSGWKKAVGQMKSAKSEKDLGKLITRYSSHVSDEWESFNSKVAQKLAPPAMDAVVKVVSKKHKLALEKPKMKFWSKGNTDNRLSMEKALLAALILPAAAATPIGLAAFFLGAGSILIDAIDGAFKSSQKRSGELRHNIGIIEDNLQKSHQLLSGLDAEKKRISQHRRVMNADIFAMTRDLKKLRSDLARAIAEDTRAGQTVDTKTVSDIKKTIVRVENSIKESEKAVKQENDVQRALADATKAVLKARVLATAEKDSLNTAVDIFNGSSSDIKTGLSTLRSALKAFKK